MTATRPKIGKIIFRLHPFRTPGQEQKVRFFGECAKEDCSNSVLHCAVCDKWWRLDRKDKIAAYDNNECPFCQHKAIMHHFFCQEHRDTCHVCYEAHPHTRRLRNRKVALGCPFRALRDGQPIQPEHEDWLRERVGELKGKELLLFLFGDDQGRIRTTPNDEQRRKKAKKKPKEMSRFGNTGRVMKLLEKIHNREVQSYEGWERGMSPDRSKHSNSERTKAGMEKARAAGKPIGRPRKKTQ